ncbi:MAG: hypothetical protein MK160_15065, partial [Rhodobacteraceae bacterium]|nr:hypothetical protein [Paracoccaceae bacterium]
PCSNDWPGAGEPDRGKFRKTNSRHFLGEWPAWQPVSDTPDGAILDQRAFWIFVLLVLVIKGAGAVSVDRLLSWQVRGHAANQDTQQA